MKWRKNARYFFTIAVFIGVGLRLPRLEQRPMHTDEAVHAIKFGQLLENGFYQYDPVEYHGPTLNYFTLIPAWSGGCQTLTTTSDTTLRLVPLFFGVVVILLLLLLVKDWGWSTVVAAAFLTALSPAMVFYSRYYIHEMLLVCFTFGAIASGFRYTRRKSILWAGCTGVFLGLMHATKETCIIAYGSIASAFVLTALMQYRYSDSFTLKNVINRKQLLIAVATALVVSILFFSSFLTYFQGIPDSVFTYLTYLNRAGHNPWHIHPWYYYIKILVFTRHTSGPIWSEAFIVLMAMIGFVVALIKKESDMVPIHLLRFFAFYTFFLTLVYSIIPYKTPWSMLSCLQGMILLAAVGIVTLIRLQSKSFRWLLIMPVIVIALVHLGWQAYQLNYKYYADPVNPYVYAHTSNDIFPMAQRIEEIARVHPDGHNMQIQVIHPDNDYWPLPWYLRSFPNVGWWHNLDEIGQFAPVIIAPPQLEAALITRWYELPPPGQRDLYVPLFDTYLELRPTVELRGYLKQELWERYRQR